MSARVVITRAWGDDGDTLSVEVTVDTSYPDVIAEAVRSALNGYAEAHGITIASETTTEE